MGMSVVVMMRVLVVIVGMGMAMIVGMGMGMAMIVTRGVVERDRHPGLQVGEPRFRAVGASAGGAHQITSNSLIFSSSPESHSRSVLPHSQRPNGRSRRTS